MDDREAEREPEGKVGSLQAVLDHELGEAAGDVVEQVLAGAQHEALGDREDLGLHHEVSLAEKVLQFLFSIVF